MFKKRRNKPKEDVPITGESILEKQTTNLPNECLVSEDGNGSGTDEADGFDSQGFVDLTPQRQATLLGPKKPCQYIGTFAVSLGSSEDGEATLATHKERTRFVKKKLKEYRFSQKGVLVALLISSDGIKVVSPDGQRVRMAHPLQRISFATCEPDFRLFAYMSHNPSPLGTAIHCHVFMTRYTRQVQELTALVGKAFQMAFAESKFPKGAELKMEPLKPSPTEPGAQGRRWARLEAQQGHEHSQHALLARVKREQEKGTANKSHEMSKQKATPPAPTASNSTPQTSFPVSAQRPHEKGTTTPETRRKNMPENSSGAAKPLYLDSETDGSPVLRRKELQLPDILDIDSSSPRSTDESGSPTSPPLPPKQRSFDENWSPSSEVALPKERSQTPPPSVGAGKSASKATNGNELNSALIKASSDPNVVAERKEVNVDQNDKPGKGTTSHEDESWYMAGIPREFVTEMLEKSEEGSFFVRDSQSRPGCYALTMRIPYDVNQTGIGNFLIVKIKDGVMIQGFNKVLPDLPSLVEHYSKNSDGLPCKLLIAGSNVLCEDEDYLNTVPVDPDYQTLSDFTAMMAELN